MCASTGGYLMQKNYQRDLLRLLAVILAAVIMALNIRTFVRTGGLFPGGANGMTLLIQRFFSVYMHREIPYTPINVLLNSIPVYIGFRYIGKKFTLFSLVMILLTGIFTDLLPGFPITNDILLIAVFGGIINGTAISICLRADATSGGTDFIAIYLSQKRGIESFDLILVLNAMILCTAGLLFGWEKALYSIIYQYVSTQTLHLLYRNYQRQTLIVVTEKADQIASRIHEVCHHGATILDAEGAYEHTKKKMVYSVISSADLGRVIPEIRAIDPHAFINSIHSESIFGHFYMKPKD